MKPAVMPYLTRALSSEALKTSRRSGYELLRRLTGRDHELRVFLRADDPYSYLLVQVIDRLRARFDVSVRYHTVLHRQAEMYPEPELWHHNACYDAAHLAELYGLDFGDCPPELDGERVEQATAALLAAEDGEHFLDRARGILSLLWHSPASPVPTPVNLDDAPVRKRLAANEALLQRLGHYFSAMVYYAGEWYWGLDRLDHLERRLIDLGLARSAEPTVQFDKTYNNFCRHRRTGGPSPGHPLVLYWSARSPYSHIALVRSVELAQFHGIALEIKPVMPMMMRGMNVPRTKKMYIFHDTKREADKLGVPYGFVADPLGPAVERCYALLDYARSQGKLVDFLLSFAHGVNAEGIRAETDAGLATIVNRCGLDWETAKPLLAGTAWRQEVEENLEEMRGLGFWGVPSFRYGDHRYWGQDRLGLIERAILREQRDSSSTSGPER